MTIVNLTQMFKPFFSTEGGELLGDKSNFEVIGQGTGGNKSLITVNIWTLNNMPGMLSIQHSPVVIRDTPITDWQWRVSTKLLEISLVYRCQSRHEGQWSGLDVINRTASNVIAGSFEAMARLKRNIIDLYKYENCRECFGESRNKLGMVQI